MATSAVNFAKQQLKQTWLNNIALLLAGFQNDYNNGVFVVTFRGCETLTTNAICDLIQEKKNVLHDNYHLLPDFYTMELNALIKRV
jgi:hypothetical protein